MKRSTWRTSGGILIVAVAGSACVGQIGDPEGKGGPGQGTSKDPIVCDGSTVSPGLAPVRRMTRFEYNNAVRDLLGDTTEPANQFPADEVSGVFDNQAATLVVTELLAQGYLTAAETVATNATADLNTLVGCDPTTSDPTTCGEKFIADFGRRAFRRPLDADAKASLENVFTTALSTWDYPTAIRLVIETALQSPRFLYRFEFGMPDPKAAGIVKLDDYEVASRLSFLLWGSVPDDTLLTAADKGELETPDQLAAQAKRLLDDPKARGMIENFHTQWLGLVKLDTTAKDTTVYPTYTDAIKTTWKAETMAFVDDVILDHDGDLKTLLTAPYSMMNADAAAFYGIQGGPSGSSFQHVDLDPKQRSGIMTQASVLAVNAHPDQTSPVYRGKFVRERLLCEMISPPPPNVNAVPPPVDPNASTRDRFSQHETDPVCASCHSLMDPIGFGFEDYDGIGLWRMTDGGKPVDDSGEIEKSKDSNGKFHGAVELAGKLAESQEVRDCIVSQWFTYAQGRPNAGDDTCSIQSLQTAFATGSYDIKDLLVALTQTDAFRYRQAVVAGQ